MLIGVEGDITLTSNQVQLLEEWLEWLAHLLTGGTEVAELFPRESLP